MFDQCGCYMSLLQDLVEAYLIILMSLLQDMVEGACLISVVLYVAAARLGGGGMFDQCGYYMSLLQDLVEEAYLICVFTLCRCCKTWWRGHV